MEKRYINKIIFKVKRDKMNGYFNFGKGKFRIQFAGDERKGGHWLFQYANRVLGDEGEKRFRDDLKQVLYAMSQDNAQIFTMYEGHEEVRYEEMP